MSTMITATKPFTPPIEEYKKKIDLIFQNNWFTNHGPLVTELEDKLRELFQSPYLLLVSNGTVALQLSIRALNLSGEIITTPFSYVATTSAIVWENCTPVFADISKETFNIDASTLEAKITSETTAILATNVYGYPCNFTEIERIAKKHNLAVIYDNAHGFGTLVNSQNSMNFGDVSTISFHATKLFHTVEGGAIVCKDKAVFERLKLLRNFGHTSPYTFDGVGVNAKMNEMCAGMGLVNLEHLDVILSTRKRQWLYYYNRLKQTDLQLANYQTESDIDYNHAYFPVVFKDEAMLLSVMDSLQENNISTRRYFFPSLNQLNYVTSEPCPVSESIASRVMCLPLYHHLLTEEQDQIIQLILSKC